MHRRRIPALGGASIALVLALSPVALAARGPAVTVRVEGKARTLLAPTRVHTHAGSITKGGAPSGAGRATSAAGAHHPATHHRWSGTFSSSFHDYFITAILGDTESGKSFFWGIWIDNRFAQSGACGIALRPGDQLLFAVVPASGTEYPTALTAPGHAVVGHAFKVKVVWFNGRGRSEPLARARVSGAGVSVVTNGRGVATVVAHHTGTLVLGAARNGYIRSAPVRVHVSG